MSRAKGKPRRGDFANVALNSYEFIYKQPRTRTTDSGGNETWNL